MPLSFRHLTPARTTRRFVYYDISVEGQVIDPRASILAWEERLTFHGDGKPLKVWVETQDLAPRQQTLKQYTKCTAIQSGSGFAASWRAFSRHNRCGRIF